MLTFAKKTKQKERKIIYFNTNLYKVCSKTNICPLTQSYGKTQGNREKRVGVELLCDSNRIQRKALSDSNEWSLGRGQGVWTSSSMHSPLAHVFLWETQAWVQKLGKTQLRGACVKWLKTVNLKRLINERLMRRTLLATLPFCCYLDLFELVLYFLVFLLLLLVSHSLRPFRWLSIENVYASWVS